MFRKIHSNRDPRDTLASELRKEFSSYFSAAAGFSKSVLQKHPRFAFGCMVVLMTISIGFSFTYFRYREEPKKATYKTTAAPVQDGLSQIMQAGERLRSTLKLKQLVDSLSTKKTLSARDSLVLDSALDRLQSLQKPIR